jgi:hypothetical protein
VERRGGGAGAARERRSPKRRSEPARSALARGGFTLVLASRAAFAQSAPPVTDPKPTASPWRGDGRIVGFVATPFGNNAAGAAVGFGVGGGVGWKRIPLTLGVDVMTAYFGTATSGVLVKAGDTLIPANLNRTDLGYYLDASLRAQPVEWLVRPYAEGFVGTKLLETRYSLSFAGSGTSTSTTSGHDWAGSIGWGAGVDIGGLNAPSLGFTLGVRRLSGADASFSRVADVGGNVVVRYTAPTSSMFYMIGIMGAFGVSSR